MTYALLILFGAFSWTLLEYVFHRFFHVSRGKNHGSREHLKHHATPEYFSPPAQKAVMATAFTGGAFTAAYFVFGLTNAIVFSSALGAMYLVYEWLHLRAHLAAPMNAYGARVRARHFHHHFVAPNMNHGVTTALWDHVFGTHIPPEVIPVPRKHAHALAWVLGADGGIDPRFTDRYRLV